MDEKNLLTIGKLSKLTGTGIKALRYYDRIGILPPAYVDPQNGYRYYTFPQVYLVETIQMCVELDIPLKEFTSFTSGSCQISYTGVLKYGTQIAKRKIAELQRKLQYLEHIQQEIDRAEQLQHIDGAKEYAMPQKQCWIEPFSGVRESSEYQMGINKIFTQIYSQNLIIGTEVGLLWIGQTQYIFVDVVSPIPKAKRKNYPEIITIPAAQWWCRKVPPESKPCSGLARAKEYFPQMLDTAAQKLWIIDTDLPLGNYDFINPVYELRAASFPEKNAEKPL